MTDSCPECGGIHFGSARCPYSDPNVQRDAAALNKGLAAIREEGERRPGQSRLVYNKTTRTIERAEPDPAYVLAEAAYMFAGFILSRKVDEELSTHVDTYFDWDEGDAAELANRAERIRELAKPIMQRAAQIARPASEVKEPDHG